MQIIEKIIMAARQAHGLRFFEDGEKCPIAKHIMRQHPVAVCANALEICVDGDLIGYEPYRENITVEDAILMREVVDRVMSHDERLEKAVMAATDIYLDTTVEKIRVRQSLDTLIKKVGSFINGLQEGF